MRLFLILILHLLFRKIEKKNTKKTQVDQLENKVVHDTILLRNTIGN
jgi:hypothetical protein